MNNHGNNKSWNTITLPCAYTVMYHYWGGIQTNADVDANGTSSCMRTVTSTLTAVTHGTLNGSTNYKTHILLIGY